MGTSSLLLPRSNISRSMVAMLEGGEGEGIGEG